MSLTDSLVVMLQTIISNGVGASIGLEAGYTQMGSAMASRLGRMFRVRRNDLRLLVGCGAAGAIAGAFNAPLTGAFYGFELVIGTYSLATFAPVAVSAIVAVSVVHAFGGQHLRPVGAGTHRGRSARLHPDPGAGHGVRPGRRRDHARRHPDRGIVPPQRRADLAAPGDRRARGRHAGAGHPGGAVVRPWRPGDRDRGALSADLCRHAGGAEILRLGDLHRFRLPRRTVLCLAVPGRGAGQDIRRRTGDRSAPPTPFRR